MRIRTGRAVLTLSKKGGEVTKKLDLKVPRGTARAIRRANGQVANDEQRAKNRAREELRVNMQRPLCWVGGLTSGHYEFAPVKHKG